MQTRSQPFDPQKPHESDRAAPVPAPARSTTIPELGIADVHDDPGLAPALATSQPMPEGKPADSPKTPEQRAQEFVPVEGGTETTSAEAMLVTAYLVMWAILLGFLLLSWRRQRAMDARIDELERALTRSDGGSEKK
jgi:hypothetical protein